MSSTFEKYFEKYLTETPEEEQAAADAAAAATPGADPNAPPIDPNATPVDPNAQIPGAEATPPTDVPPAAEPTPEATPPAEQPPAPATEKGPLLKFPKKLELITNLLKDELAYSSVETKLQDAKNFILVRGKLGEEETKMLEELADKIKVKIKIENTSIGKTEMTKIAIENKLTLDDFMNLYSEGGVGPGMAQEELPGV